MKSRFVSSSPFLVGAMKDDPEWTFLDTARIHVKGGDGGNSACVAHTVEEPISIRRRSNDSNHSHTTKRRGRGGRRRRNNTRDEEDKERATIAVSSPVVRGGKGGNGGSVYLVCDSRFDSLVSLAWQVHFQALDGEDGLMGNRHGSNGSDSHIKVPPGTVVRELQSQAFVGELFEDGESLLLADGGSGGSKKKQQHQHAQELAISCDSEKGEERWLSVEFKIRADVGIVGLANSGKTSILASITNAKPRIADYPFTTTCPNLGVCQIGSGSGSFTICDLPGLIDGASEGAGMGEAFLRHVKNCNVLLHVVDASTEDPLGDFETVNRELDAFDGKSNIRGDFLADKPQVVALSKCDKIPEKRLDRLVQALKQKVEHSHVLPVSVLEADDFHELRDALGSFL